MSLRVWLPLNGDLRNQGVSGVTITPNTSVAVQTDGKIGKCYRPATITLTNLDDFSFNNSSFCFWAKTSATTSWQLIIGIDNSNLSQIHGIYVADASRYKLEYNPSLNIYDAEIAQWHHYAFIIQSGKSQAYCDGVLKATSEEAVTDDVIGRLRLGVGTAISLNDVRIYDHALSAAEVREIAQGLVLHYKLDSFQGNYGNPNLCKNSRTFGTGWGGSGTVISDTFNGFAIKYKDNSSGTGSTDTVVYSSVTTVNPNEVYTVSFWAKADIAHSISCFFYNNASGIVQVSRTVASPGNSHTSGDGYINFGLTTEWKHYWITWTFGGSGNAANKTLILGRNSAGSSGISIAQVKLERGSSATAWTPHPDDNEYLPIIVEDNSGHNHNGTITGTSTISSNTVRYSSAMEFPGTAYIKLISPSIEVRTISLWAKWNTIPSGQSIIYVDQKSKTGLGLASNGILINTNQTGHTFSKTSLVANTWYHFVIVSPNGSSNATRQLYINGVEQTALSSTNSWSYTLDELQLGKRSTSSDGFNGEISDFRMYCTALDADAVRQLYEVGAKIDNKGGIHTYEFTESLGIEENAKFVNNSATSVAYDAATDIYTIVSPVGTSAWGYGVRLADTPALMVPYGATYRWTAEVWTPVALTVNTDYNNTATTTWAGNDNDATSTRLSSGTAIPANTWTRIYRGASNTHSSNTNHLSIRDYSSLGLVTNGQSGPVTWKIRHLQWYIVDTTFKPEIKKTGVFEAEHFTEVEQNLNKPAQFNKQMFSVNGNELIEL